LEACRALYAHRRLQSESQRVVPAMLRVIREEIGTYRLDALGYLMAIRAIPGDLEPLLRTLLKSHIPVERIEARRALIQVGISDSERDAMIKSMLESLHLDERLATAPLLIEFGKRELAIAVLEDLVASDDIAIRARAQRLLGSLKSGPGIP
jgi:FimV-like protein